MTLARNMERLAQRGADSTAIQPRAATLDVTLRSDPHLTSVNISRVYERMLSALREQDLSSPSYRRRVSGSWLDEDAEIPVNIERVPVRRDFNPFASDSLNTHVGGARDMYDGPMPKVGDEICYISWSVRYKVVRVNERTKEFWIAASNSSEHRYDMSRNFTIYPSTRPKSGFAKFVNDHGL